MQKSSSAVLLAVGATSVTWNCGEANLPRAKTLRSIRLLLLLSNDDDHDGLRTKHDTKSAEALSESTSHRAGGATSLKHNTAQRINFVLQLLARAAICKPT